MVAGTASNEIPSTENTALGGVLEATTISRAWLGYCSYNGGIKSNEQINKNKNKNKRHVYIDMEG